ncbi:MAG TPA: peptidylprolyl isomerase [Candidatus Polarisedimenticolia bacterium]|nr:peptidylprolyl isomerase [Candidatus Polarisedimenticolia bacterium]
MPAPHSRAVAEASPARPSFALSVVFVLMFGACSTGPATSSGKGQPAEGAGPASPGASPAATDSGRPGQPVSRVIAEVNGTKLYEAFYLQNLDFIENRLSRDEESADVERYLNARFEAIDMLVNDELIYQEALRLGVVVPESDVTRELASASVAAGGEGVFFAAMQARGIPRDQAVEGIRKRLTIDRFMRERLAVGIDATEAEMLAHYNANLERFTPEIWLKVYQILIRCPAGSTPQQTNDARQRAERILKNIRAGEPFQKMAREFSEDGSAEASGNLGFLKRGFAPPEFDAVVFALAPGQVSDVFRTETGFHIVTVTDKRGGAPRDFAAVKEDCRRAVLRAKQAAAVNDLASRLRSGATIQTYLE